MYTRKQKRKQKGGQPLSYTNPNYNEPSALPGSPILHSSGIIARPEISQRGGTQMVYTDIGKWVPWTERGANLILPTPQKGGQPLSYNLPEYREVSALPGAPLLHSNGSIARPEIGMKGGFTPSIMSNLVGNASLLTPLAMTAAYRLLSNKTRKQRGGNGEEWETYRQQAKLMLQGVAPGKANGKWVNKLAKILKEKEKKNVAVALAEFAEEKGADKKVVGARPVFATKLNEWEYDQRQARKELAKYGEPSVAEVTHLAALRTGRKGKEGNANAYLEDFQQRYMARKEAQKAKELEKEEKKIKKQIAQAEKVLPVPKVKAAPPAINERPWAEIRAEAKAELVGLGKKIRRGNTIRYASMKRLKNQARLDEFLAEFRARPGVKEESKEASSESNEEFLENKPAVAAPKPKRKTHRVKKGREEWNGYQQGAKKMLEKIGPATSAEISELAKLIKDGENVRPYLNEFEGRVKDTKVRVARLEREREERKISDEDSKYNEEVESEEEVEAVPAPVPAAAIAAPKPRMTFPPPAAIAEVGAPIAPVNPGKLAAFQQRLAELAKKYPTDK